MGEWHRDYGNVTQLGSALLAAGFTGKQLQAYYEKPHNWGTEWRALQSGQEVLELVLDGESLEEALKQG